ncbi:TIGR02452 family protein [Nocardiopsis potens]|uniref:TIGR02452 family protein n=1 Tax=Nocardiopsis potens TaxID=1246458 RepID=UPI0004782D70|nr:TIGR02452 family protein [Nocardiopsis potens]
MSTRLRRQWAETRDAVERGYYTAGGRRADLTAHLAAMRRGTRLYLPEELPALAEAAAGRPGTPAARTEVTGETTLQAARRLAADGPVAVLNFASARNPGGGVANGARAQEESLARSSALYDSLVRCPEFYDHHRAERSLLYTDRIIYSPDVPVFRDDGGEWLDEPYTAAFLTAAAPNRRMIERNTPERSGQVRPALAARSRGVLAVAADRGHARLVLGAWGCGVFGNRPAEVAEAFRAHLTGAFAGVFEEVVFAVLDRPDGTTRRAFTDAFAG